MGHFVTLQARLSDFWRSFVLRAASLLCMPSINGAAVFIAIGQHHTILIFVRLAMNGVFLKWPNDQRIATAFGADIGFKLGVFLRCKWRDQVLKLGVNLYRFHGSSKRRGLVHAGRKVSGKADSGAARGRIVSGCLHGFRSMAAIGDGFNLRFFHPGSTFPIRQVR